METALVFLNDRREFWSQQKPNYSKDEKVETESKKGQWDVVMSRMIDKRPKVFGRKL